MRVIAFPADDGGCGMYRVTMPGRALIDQGFDVFVAEVNPDGTATEGGTLRLLLYRDAEGVEHIHGFDRFPDADVVVFQRPMQPLIAEAIPLLQAAGIAVVVEVDDDFERISPNNVAFKPTHPKWSPRRNWMHLRHACEQADWVTVSTPALAKRYGRHGRCTVIPNYVPRRYLQIPTYDDEGVPTFIWSGSILTHADDLAELRGSLQQVVRKVGGRMRVVGTGKGVEFKLGVEVEACGWQPLDLYPDWIAQGSVGVVPLTLTDFNEAKSSLKGLEFASVGVPFVASPTGPYRELAKAGIGRTAAKARDWVGGLIWTLERRQELSFRYRAIVAANYTIEANAWRWWDAWQHARDRRSGEIARVAVARGLAGDGMFDVSSVDVTSVGRGYRAGSTDQAAVPLRTQRG